MFGGGASCAAFAAGRSRSASTPACDARAAGAPDVSVVVSTGGGGGVAAEACIVADGASTAVGVATALPFAGAVFVAAGAFVAGGTFAGVVAGTVVAVTC